LKSIGHADFLAQGTLYPDVIESVAIGNNPAALIKSHHNVGGLPARMRLRLVEPLRELFKDEVRAVGARLGLPRAVVWRQPFPAPAWACACWVRSRPTGWKSSDARMPSSRKKCWRQAGIGKSGSPSAFSPVKSVGVVGDERNYAWVIGVRVVESIDAMTAD